MVPIYSSQSAAAAFRFARRHAATTGQYVQPPPAQMEVEHERLVDQLRHMGDMFLMVTWNRCRLPVYDEGKDEATGQRWGTIYKVWSVYKSSEIA